MSSLIGKTLEHYRIQASIGKGGMATVYRAVDERSGAEVAIKILSPTISADRRFIKRFRREAELVSQLKHPHIVPVLAYGESDGYVFTAMEYVEGETLYRRMTPGVGELRGLRAVDRAGRRRAQLRTFTRGRPSRHQALQYHPLAGEAAPSLRISAWHGRSSCTAA